MLPDSIVPPVIEPPFTDEDLDNYFVWLDFQPEHVERDLEGPELPEHLAPVAAWSVCDTGSAEFAMRTLAHTEALIADRREAAKAWKAQIDRWLAGELARPTRTVNFFTGQLEAYARQKREEDKVKTLKLLSGEVTSRLNPARPEVADEERFISWARNGGVPDVVKAKWSPVMDGVKKLVQFRTVVVPNSGTYHDALFDVGDHLVALPASVDLDADDINEFLEGLDINKLLGVSFHEESSTAVWRDPEGRWWLVPGVVEVPAEVTYQVKPAKA